MANRATTFANLPAEVIQHIASFLPAEEVLTLLKTSRKIRNICDDMVVFKNLLKTADLKINETWHCSELDECTDKNKLKRYAVAQSRAIGWDQRTLKINLTHDELHERTISPLGWELWAPQLAVLRHPLMVRITTERLIEQLELGSRAYKSRYNSPARKKVASAALHTVSFLAIHVLLAQALEEGPLGLSRHPWHAFTQEFGQHDIMHKAAEQLMNASVPPSTIPHLLIAYAFLPIYQEHSKRRSLHIQDVCPPPNPALMDLPSLLTLPLPFSPSSVEDFASSHIPTMTSRPFLESDEWVGHYCYSGRQNMPFDPAMRGLHFQSGDTVDEKRMLHASGYDGCGPFVIDGWISTQTGEVEATKMYTGPQPVSWHWSGTMGKFGIVGRWGQVRREWRWAQGGLFWLWRKGWCHRRRGPIDSLFQGDEVV